MSAPVDHVLELVRDAAATRRECEQAFIDCAWWRPRRREVLRDQRTHARLTLHETVGWAIKNRRDVQEVYRAAYPEALP